MILKAEKYLLHRMNIPEDRDNYIMQAAHKYSFCQKSRRGVRACPEREVSLEGPLLSPAHRMLFRPVGIVIKSQGSLRP